MINMRERKYVKFRSDMYEDTKFKIIDMKPERDLIHYLWTRFVTLAGKVNLEGALYMSRNLPYTIETLSIEFNRSKEQIKLALAVFIELEMIELIDGRIYRVKNFAKHQNIKMKGKIKPEDKAYDRKNAEGVKIEVSSCENYINEDKKLDSEDKKSENNVYEEEITSIKNDYKEYQEIIYTGINKDSNISSEIVDDSFNGNIPIPLETRKNKKRKGKKKMEESLNMNDEEDSEDDEIICFTEEERPLGEGERIILEMTF
jgi:predicted phage replisome organizer